MAIYVGLGVPEVWAFDGDTLRIHLLQKNRAYSTSQVSLCLPALPVQEIVPFLQPDATVGDTARVRRFVAQVRHHFSQDRG
jgi:hypothetical protein